MHEYDLLYNASRKFAAQYNIRGVPGDIEIGHIYDACRILCREHH